MAGAQVEGRGVNTSAVFAREVIVWFVADLGDEQVPPSLMRLGNSRKRFLQSGGIDPFHTRCFIVKLRPGRGPRMAILRTSRAASLLKVALQSDGKPFSIWLR
jgi:hypothetical protein